jgi:cytochrome c oxidase subunit II
MTPPRKPRRAVRAAAAAALGAVVLAGCSGEQNWFDPAGPEAQQIDNLQKPVFAIAGIVGVIVFAVAFVIMFKFSGKRRTETPQQVHGHPKLEIMWTIAPAILLAIIVVPTIATIFSLAEKPANPIKVTVIGQQWWWEYDYPGLGIVTANELVVPAGVPIELSITSRDVIHSYWIPRLNGKKDAVPNRVHFLKMQADEPGTYWGQCTEFCGLSHANMRQRVVALPQDQYDKWVANQQKPAATPTDEEATLGEAVFVGQCVRCHSVNGLKDQNGDLLVSQPQTQLVSGAAPNLTHLMSRTVFAGGTFPLKKEDCVNPAEYDAQYPTGTSTECLDRTELESWLRNPPAMKPMDVTPDDNGLIRGMPNLNLSENQIDQLVAYLATLK